MTRFELCVNVPINITVVLAYAVNGEGTLYYVPLKYEVEMWAELANNSRTWDVTANIKTVLPIDPTEVPVPVTITQTGALNCSNDPYCTESSQSPVEETNNLGMYTGDGSVTTLKGSFSDATTTATETLDNYLSIDLGTESPWTKTQGAPILMPFGGENVQNPIRCDNQSKIPGYTNGGCIVRYAPAVWTVSDKLYPGMDLVVKHMAAASCQLPGYQGLDGCPGKPGATPLTYDPSKEDANRGKACPSTMQPPPNQVALGNTSCDEYPMAKTDQGAASGGPYDTCWVPPAENSSQGGAFTTGLVGPSRMFPGDSFYVHVTYFGNTPGCDGLLVGGGSVTPDNGLDGMFNSYGDNATCADWSGGDATNSVALPDGERAWFFSDTYLNSPAARKSLWYASSLHNSMVIQDSSGLTQTITGGNTCQETNQSISFWNRYAITPAVAPDASTGGFYWTGDQMVVGSNVVKFYYHGHPVTLPGGGHSFTIDYPAVATIPVGSLEGSPVINITPTHFSCGASNIIWGTSLLNWDGNVYVYGWQSTGTGSDGIFLAKTTEASLTSTGSWQLYDGMSGSNPVWGSCSSTPAPLPISNGTTGFSVDFVNNSLWLVQFDYTNGQANAAGAIGAHPSATPWGFGNSTVALYDPPTGTDVYPYYYQDYEARIQPGLGPAGQVVISYNVNTTAVDTGCVSANAHDATIYRPRFIDVPISMFDTAEAKAAPGTTTAAGRASTAAGGASTAAGRVLPAYGIRQSGPPFPAAHPPALAALVKSAASAAPAASADGIDGSTDWYQMQLGGTCPTVPAPSSAPTLTQQPPGGVVAATWQNVGTDVWYYAWICDETENNCSAEGTSPPWMPAWPTSQGNLWSTTPSGNLDPIDATTTQGNNTNGHTFAVYIQSFGAGNGQGGGDSPEASVTVTIPPVK